jgi:hypothetical protein
MQRNPKSRGVVGTAMLVAALAVLALAPSAQAKLTGEFTKFQYCPYTTVGVARCLYSVTNGGEVVLGTKKVPVEKEVILQGGYNEPPEEGPEAGFSKFFAATNGITLSKAAQNVPGGLLGIVPPEKSPALVKALSKFFFENALTGVTSTLELAGSASDIRLSEVNLAGAEGVALKLPVKIHLENPFLGKSCYVGSSGSPVKFELTSGVTNPPGPNKSISGKTGTVDFLEEVRILRLTGAELVDNAWSAPAASGCGGILAFLVNPIINGQIGLPSAAGKNTTILKNTIMTTTSFALKKNNEANP